eukprot:11189492-Lingulodinium_polyedra.AAC.1
MARPRAGGPRGFTSVGVGANVEICQEFHGVCGQAATGERPSMREMAMLEFVAEEGFQVANTFKEFRKEDERVPAAN